MSLELLPFNDDWPEDDPHANFKREVAHYSRVDPWPTLEALGQGVGIPAGALARYVLVKWAASASEALLTLEPVALQQMRQHVDRAEAAGTDEARVEAYHSLRQMIAWLQAAVDGEMA